MAEPALPLEAAWRIDQACDRFEAAWKKAGSPPRLEEFLDTTDPEKSSLSSLLEELIALDVHYRRHRGEQPHPDEYQARFPNLEAAYLTDAFHYPPPEKGPPSVAEVGQLLHDVTPRRELSRGRRHAVFLADDAQGRSLVLKVWRADAEQRRQWVQAAQAVAGLSHPCLATPLRVVEAGEFCCATTAFCPGPTLGDWLRVNARPDPRLLAALVAALADAVHHLHQHGIPRQQLTATNVVLAPRGAAEEAQLSLLPPELPFVPKLLDAGFASALDAAEAAHPTADVSDLGALLYEMLTSWPHAPGQPAPRQLQPDVPPALDTICMKALRPQANGGYGNARELADDLAMFAAGRARGRRFLYWLLGAGLVGAAILALVMNRP